MVKKYTIIVITWLIVLGFSQNAYAVEKAAHPSAILASRKTEAKEDNRIEILDAFLKKYNSPLIPNASIFVKSADKYELDYRLVVAISGVESTFGKQIPPNSYNAWGWGIYGDNRIYFSSFDEAIETISKGLREQYINTWKAETVYDIGRFYAVSPTWAHRVDYFMNKIDEFAINNPDLTLPISL